MAFTKEQRKAANVFAAFQKLVESRKSIIPYATLCLFSDGTGGVLRNGVSGQWWLEWGSLDEALIKLAVDTSSEKKNERERAERAKHKHKRQ